MSSSDRDSARILVVDDEDNILSVLRIVLKSSGYEVTTARTESEAREAFLRNAPDLVLQDMRLSSPTSGLELLNFFKIQRPEVPVIIITAYSTWDSTLNAMKDGAYDFVKKPFDNDAIREVVARAIAHRRSASELARSSRKSGASATEILGNSPQMRHVLSLIDRVSGTDLTVLITGESGTGKELVARALHYCSPRAGEAFISVNSGAFPESLLESELFGHAKGAFSGAIASKKGLIEVADKGTFFFDEVGDLPLDMQVKLLRVLEEQQFFPVGATSPKRVDVRFIGATNKDLMVEVEAGRFREDLFYRLNVIPIELPPLRERKEDLELLASHFMTVMSQRLGRPIDGISERAREQLRSYDWPGNVRELQNTIERSIALTRGNIVEELLIQRRRGSSSTEILIEPGPVTIDPKATSLPEGYNLDQWMAEVERGIIRSALQKTQGNLTKAAQLLGITFRSIRYKVQKLEIRDRDENSEN